MTLTYSPFITNSNPSPGNLERSNWLLFTLCPSDKCVLLFTEKKKEKGQRCCGMQLHYIIYPAALESSRETLAISLSTTDNHGTVFYSIYGGYCSHVILFLGRWCYDVVFHYLSCNPVWFSLCFLLLFWTFIPWCFLSWLYWLCFSPFDRFLRLD